MDVLLFRDCPALARGFLLTACYLPGYRLLGTAAGRSPVSFAPHSMAKTATCRSIPLCSRPGGIWSLRKMCMSIGGGLIVSDWNSKLEKANGELAELHVKISFQREIVQQLSAVGT